MRDWSPIPPEAPGFWWMRDRAGEARVAHVVNRGELRIALPGLDDDYPRDAKSFEGMEWLGPIGLPTSWARGEPAAPGWYWIRDLKLLTIVYLFRPWPDDEALWVAVTSVRVQPLRRARLGGFEWAGPLEPGTP